MSGKLFNSEVLEKLLESMEDPHAFADLEDIFQALRDPDFGTERALPPSLSAPFLPR